MLAYAIRRILISVPILIVSTMIIFLVVSLSGNPLDAFIGPGKRLTPAAIEALRHKYLLNLSIPDRYWHWITGLFGHGNWGPSTQNIDIGSQLGQALGTSARLVLVSIILAAILAVIVGVVSAIKQYSFTDYATTLTGFLFLSLPVFWFAILLKEAGIYANLHSGHQIFDTIGEATPALAGGFWAHVGDDASHLILPTITLALTSYAAWSRYNRASMLDVLNSDYVRLARAKGLSPRRVMVRHALRTALIPLVTVMTLDIAGIIGSTVITESIFQWHAMGTFLLNAIRAYDSYAVLAWLLVTGFIIIMFNLFADLFYAVLDPRIRYE